MTRSAPRMILVPRDTFELTLDDTVAAPIWYGDAMGNRIQDGRRPRVSADPFLTARALDSLRLVGMFVGTQIAAASGLGLPTAHFVVRVRERPMVSLSLAPKAFTMTVGRVGKLPVRMLDAKGRLLREQTVTYGSSDPSVASIDNRGIVRAISVGTATLTASAGGQWASAEATVVDQPASNFSIEIRFASNPGFDTAVVAPFARAAVTRLREAIVGASPTERITKAVGDQGRCFGLLAGGFDEVLTGLVVYMTGDHAPRRDAAGEACLLRSGGTTAVGAVAINIDRLPTEIAVGNVEAMLMHELLHTLGLVRPHFAGSNAMAAAREFGIIDAGATSLPTTNDGHWDGVLFAGELMTGMSVRGLLSMVTVMALRDLGYVVEPGASDLFGPGLWRS